MRKRKLVGLLSIVVIAILVAPVGYYFFLRGNSDALWRMVSQDCLVSWSASRTPGACLTVDLDQRYVLFKDARGPHHDLVMPTYSISGLESPELEQDASPNFMALAWDARSRLSNEVGLPIQDDRVALAINSRRGRSQDHLHVHVACLHVAAHALITRVAPRISHDWTPLPEKIEGSHYIARRISRDQFAKTNPIALLNDYVRESSAAPGDFGLALTRLQDGDFVLLATGLNLLKFDLGSAGEIQDFTCALARQAINNGEG